MSNIAAASDLNEVKVIDGDGDVLLVIGATKQSLRVSSRALSVSPVFKSMLGPHFREGQQPRSTAGPVPILLPEDNYDGTRVMCQMLHLLKVESDEEHGSNCIYDYRAAAVTMKKYQVLDIFHYHLVGVLYEWLYDYPEEDAIDVVIEAVVLAYLLDCNEAFEKATAQLIKNCYDGTMTLLGTSVIDLLPASSLRTYH
ncbi:unnamed protein product [Cercospora beticola]|nr:unnamed protein product [Cercospora beticola]